MEKIGRNLMMKNLIEEIELLKSFSEDVEIKQKQKDLEKITQEIKYIEGKIAAYSEVLQKIQEQGE